MFERALSGGIMVATGLLLNWQLLLKGSSRRRRSQVHRGERTAKLLLDFDRRVVVVDHRDILLLRLLLILLDAGRGAGAVVEVGGDHVNAVRSLVFI